MPGEGPGRKCTVVSSEEGRAAFLFFSFHSSAFYLQQHMYSFYYNKSYFLFKRVGEKTSANNASKPNNMRK